MSIDYDIYLRDHITNVNKSLRWMADNLSLTDLGFDQSDISNAIDHVITHDYTKTSAEEYRAYDDYFYGGNRSYAVVTAFNYAWLHHIHHNPHHWQYWILHNDDPELGQTVLEMPKCYILEMIADWWSFSWKTDKLTEIFDWYEKRRNYILLNDRTRKLVDSVLGAMLNKLQEDSLAHSDLDEENKKYGVPEQKKFPMPDADHVRSAIRFFNYVDKVHEKELAEAILKRMKEYGLVLGKDITVGDENRFKNYIPEDAKDE